MQMVTIKSQTLRNEPMNIRGVNLMFDQHGVCRKVDPQLAILIAPMKGFKIMGLTEEDQAAADQRVHDVLHQKNTIRPGFARGIPSKSHAEQPSGFVTDLAVGRMMPPKSEDGTTKRVMPAGFKKEQLGQKLAAPVFAGAKPKKMKKSKKHKVTE